MRVFRVWLVIGVLLGAAACGRKVASVSVSPNKLKIYGIGRSQRMTARLLDKKAQPIDEGSVTWSSSKDTVASIDASGRLTANGAGKTLISATFEKLVTQVPVEVIDIKTIEIVPPSLHLMGLPGTRLPLHATARDSKERAVEIPVQWASSNTDVATVDPKGVVVSVGPGTTVIVAKLGDLQAACEVVVALRDLARLEVRPATAILRAGDVQKFEVLGFGADGRPIEGLATVFESSDPGVAKVDPVGVAIGVAQGTATIRVTLGALTAEATLLVN
jgi:uncharacterized protein YjdB